MSVVRDDAFITRSKFLLFFGDDGIYGGYGGIGCFADLLFLRFAFVLRGFFV